jgi:hypothetical protein
MAILLGTPEISLICISTLIHLFQSFVRSKLEYASIIWFPHHAVHIASIEHLQRRFLKYLCFREDERYPPIGYSQTILLERFSFKTLSERNKLINLLFLYKILHNLIDCCSLLSQINFCAAGWRWDTKIIINNNMGGIWEAGVKSCKHHFKRIVGNALLRYEELYTLLMLIESCLNSRPITPMSNDPHDLEALTPGHFLIGAP